MSEARAPGKDAPSSELQELTERARIFSGFLATAAMDLLFLAGWVLLHEGADLVFNELRELQWLERSFQTALTIVFNVSTLIVVVAYIAKDVRDTVVRIWGRK